MTVVTAVIINWHQAQILQQGDSSNSNDKLYQTHNYITTPIWQ